MTGGDLTEDARQVIAEGRSGIQAPELVRARVRRSVASKLLNGAVAVSLAHASSLLAAGSKLGVALAVAGGVGAGAWYGFSESAASGTTPALEQTSALQHTSALRRTSTARQTDAGQRARLQPAREFQAVEGTGQAPVEPQQGDAATPMTTGLASSAGSKVSAGSTRSHAVTPDDRGAGNEPEARLRKTHEPEPPAGGLTQEVRLLADASARLNQGDAAGASRLLSEYDRQFKAKLLIQERTATGVLVHCALGNVDAARRTAKRFYDRWPRSPLARRISSSCAGDAGER